jgi:hypothetical protein
MIRHYFIIVGLRLAILWEKTRKVYLLARIAYFEAQNRRLKARSAEAADTLIRLGGARTLEELRAAHPNGGL